MGPPKEGVRGGLELVYVGAGQRNLKSPTVGCLSSTSEDSVNFCERGKAEIKDDPIPNGETIGGPVAHRLIDYTCHSGASSSVGSSMSERRGSINANTIIDVEEGPKTPESVRRLRDLWEQGTKQSCLRWRTKGGLGPLHYGINSSSRLSRCSFAESVSDIEHCNNRLRLEEKVAESALIWDAGKHLGVKCSGEEVDVVVELECMEVRDKDVKKRAEEGTSQVD